MRRSYIEEDVLDVQILQRVDEICGAIHTTRANVLTCSVFALVGDLPDVKPWTELDYVVAGRIMRKLHRVGHESVRNLRSATRHDGGVRA